jgi:hypothetical protein
LPIGLTRRRIGLGEFQRIVLIEFEVREGEMRLSGEATIGFPTTR